MPLIVWSCAEQAVTLVCIGIPLLRPLYRHVFKRGNLSGSSKTYYKQGEGTDGQAYKMSGLSKKQGSRSNQLSRDQELSLGNQGQTVTDIGVLTRNQSDEHILGSEGARKSSDAGSSGKGGIRIRENVRVEWTSGAAGDASRW